MSPIIIRLLSWSFMGSFKIVAPMCRDVQQWSSLGVTHMQYNVNVSRQGASDLIAATLLCFDSMGRLCCRAAMSYEDIKMFLLENM